MAINTVVAAARILVARVPGDHVAAVSQSCDLRCCLIVVSLGIDQNFRTLSNTAGIIELAAYIPALSATNLIIRAAAVLPSDEEAAVLETGNFRPLLFVPCPGIDLELITKRLAAGAITLGKDTVTGAVLIIGFPSNDITAVGQSGHGRLLLVALNVGIDLELFAVCRRKRDFGSVTEADALNISERIRTPVAVRGVGVDDLAVGYVDPVRVRITLEDGDIVTLATVQHIVTQASDKRIVASLTLQMIGTVATRQDITTNAANQKVIAIFTVDR